jgi:uncharacterized membrane protein
MEWPPLETSIGATVIASSLGYAVGCLATHNDSVCSPLWLETFSVAACALLLIIMAPLRRKAARLVLTIIITVCAVLLAINGQMPLGEGTAETPIAKLVGILFMGLAALWLGPSNKWFNGEAFSRNQSGE